MNLLTNARDAIERGREDGEKGDPGLIEILARRSVSKMGYVDILIRDNGRGISLWEQIGDRDLSGLRGASLLGMRLRFTGLLD